MQSLRLAAARFGRQSVVNLSSTSVDNIGAHVYVQTILEEHKAFVCGLDDAVYTFYSPLFECTVGQHTRHSLDHIRKPLELIAAHKKESGESILHYDIRDRCTSVEKDRHAAIEQIEQLERTLCAMSQINLAQPVHAAFMLSADGHEVDFKSTFNRELAFAVHHCIHHNALSKVLLRHHFPEQSVPKDFGKAPSTANFYLMHDE
ncbi:hypothetical protein KXD40_001488 [Peronospora effusa]|uniref:DinB-like domain-containing protein n=1 Tax=Peronospora effusa TaxID=542832 RepID=A0A3M6VJZ6_9STRA|nr:hypothetical protein DD238_001148 [Peronospora effusa]RQM13819.1 hypothetical protein DD237_002029 [Peronospora effusa]UIZ26811.1 hypothetical protein KXD40_001488 [Peronospora effusa]CAI5711140.1 unnamed protein product [Peronospora effusa]